MCWTELLLKSMTEDCFEVCQWLKEDNVAEDRGALFVRQEDLEDTIKKLLQYLNSQGTLLANFGAALKTAPALITFPNAPHGLSSSPLHLHGKSTFEWSQLESAASPITLARKIQELRQAEFELEQVKKALARR